MIDYETEHFKGIMLRAGPETAAAAVEYPLELNGWRDVCPGLFNTAWRPDLDQRHWVKLTEDPAFSCLFLQAPDVDKGQVIQDLFWRTAGLTGQCLSFKQVAIDYSHELGLEFHASYRFCDEMAPLYFGRIRKGDKDVPPPVANGGDVPSPAANGGRMSPPAAEWGTGMSPLLPRKGDRNVPTPVGDRDVPPPTGSGLVAPRRPASVGVPGRPCRLI